MNRFNRMQARARVRSRSRVNPYLSLAADDEGQDELGADELGAADGMGADELGADELGAEELMGADELGADGLGADELGGDAMGALIPFQRLQLARRRRRVQLEREFMAQQRRVRWEEHERLERMKGQTVVYGLDSGSTLVAPNASVLISVTPQRRNIPRRISVSDATANTFGIYDIRAGVEPILATTGMISTAIFGSNSTAPDFRSVIIEVGMDFSVSVTNIGAQPARFLATVMGRALHERMC